MSKITDESEAFVWTEALGCGEILRPMLDSYLVHHSFPIHVICYESDLKELPISSRIKLIVINQRNAISNRIEVGSTESELRTAYQKGHHGTATLWASIITSRTEKFLIHVDSDTIFLADVISPIMEKLKEGFGVVGTRRPYRHRSSGMTLLSKTQHFFSRDCVNTHAFGFQRERIKFSRNKIISLINGDSGNRIFNRIFPVIDFFDRLTFFLSRVQGIYYLDSEKQGRSGFHNRYGEFESKMISFAAVGSGYAFFNGNAKSTSPSYEQFAISSYALYSKHLLDKDIGIAPLESPYLEDKIARLDKKKWNLMKVD